MKTRAPNVWQTSRTRITETDDITLVTRKQRMQDKWYYNARLKPAVSWL
jgi:hypothetical protein